MPRKTVYFLFSRSLEMNLPIPFCSLLQIFFGTFFSSKLSAEKSILNPKTIYYYLLWLSTFYVFVPKGYKIVYNTILNACIPLSFDKAQYLDTLLLVNGFISSKVAIIINQILLSQISGSSLLMKFSKLFFVSILFVVDMHRACFRQLN